MISLLRIKSIVIPLWSQELKKNNMSVKFLECLHRIDSKGDPMTPDTFCNVTNGLVRAWICTDKSARGEQSFLAKARLQESISE